MKNFLALLLLLGLSSAAPLSAVVVTNATESGTAQQPASTSRFERGKKQAKAALQSARGRLQKANWKKITAIAVATLAAGVLAHQAWNYANSPVSTVSPTGSGTGSSGAAGSPAGRNANSGASPSASPSSIVQPSSAAAAGQKEPGTCAVIGEHEGVSDEDAENFVYGSTERRKKMVAAGFPVDVVAKNTFSFSLLEDAALTGNLSKLQEGLRLGCDPNAGFALRQAAWRGNIDLVRELIRQRGIELNAPGDVGNRGTPLCVAASQGHDQVVSELLDAGAKVDVVDKYGETALQGAIHATWLRKGRFDSAIKVVKALVNAGASVPGASGAIDLAKMNLAPEQIKRLEQALVPGSSWWPFGD